MKDNSMIVRGFAALGGGAILLSILILVWYAIILIADGLI